MNKLFASEVFRRTFAEIWFALAAAVPVGYFFALDPFDGRGLPVLGDSVILMIAIPIFLAGVCGLALGAGIFDIVLLAAEPSSMPRRR